MKKILCLMCLMSPPPKFVNEGCLFGTCVKQRQLWCYNIWYIMSGPFFAKMTNLSRLVLRRSKVCPSWLSFCWRLLLEIRASEVHWARTSSSIAKSQTSTAVLNQTMLKPGYANVLVASFAVLHWPADTQFEEATHALARYASRSGFTHCVPKASLISLLMNVALPSLHNLRMQSRSQQQGILHVLDNCLENAQVACASALDSCTPGK